MLNELRNKLKSLLENAPIGHRFGEETKEAVRARQNFVCALCGEAQEDRKLSVHHIDENRWNNKTSNLIALCRKCHYNVCANDMHCIDYNRRFDREVFP